MTLEVMADDMAASATSPNSSLNPTAATFTMPLGTGSNRTAASPQSNENPPQSPKLKKPDMLNARSTTAENIAEAGAGVKLTGAQLKRQKAAEKAARRADKVAERGEQAQQQQAPGTSGPTKPEATRQGVSGKKDSEAFHKRTGSTGAKQLPVRSQPQVPDPKPQEMKRVPMFSHLYTKEKKATLAGAGREIHPAVLALGLQLRDYVICGGNARCVAMLLVFKKVIQAYTTPSGVALSRHLTTHISHQISYLSHARPLSISQGNSIRWLKKLISALDPDLAETEAKQFLCQSIDQFIGERITLADEVIAKEASTRIVDGDVILTYAKSSVVEKTLLTAHRQGKRFKVIVVDSRPLFEGKNHVRSLLRAGLQVQYCLLSAVADVVEDATKCILGASAMLGNGRLSSRAGTAMVAMMAKEVAANIPVIVLCESIKFTGRVALDSLMMNELGEADLLVELEQSDTITTDTPTPSQSTKGGKKSKDEDESEDKKSKKGLDGWKDQQNLYLLTLMYDITPAEYLDMVVSEYGTLPPTAVPVVNGVHGEEE